MSQYYSCTDPGAGSDGELDCFDDDVMLRALGDDGSVPLELLEQQALLFREAAGSTPHHEGGWLEESARTSHGECELTPEELVAIATGTEYSSTETDTDGDDFGPMSHAELLGALGDIGVTGDVFVVPEDAGHNIRGSFIPTQQAKDAYMTVLRYIQSQLIDEIRGRDTLEDQQKLALLSQDFRLLEELHSNLLGHCYCTHKQWKHESPEKKVALINRTSAVYVRLVNDNGMLLPIASCIGTLLHEFAHVITPGELLHTGFPEGGSGRRNPTGRRKKRWHYEPHSDTFFDNFAYLLRIAEARSLFVLPSKKSKYTRRALQRFDDRDLCHAPPPPSCAPLFADADGSLALTREEIEAIDSGEWENPRHAVPPPRRRTQLRLVVVGGRRGKIQKKTVVLDSFSVSAIRHAASTKLGFKAKRVRVKLHGRTFRDLADEDVRDLADGTEIHIS